MHLIVPGMDQFVFPQNSYVEDLTPGTSECDINWKQGLRRGN